MRLRSRCRESVPGGYQLPFTHVQSGPGFTVVHADPGGGGVVADRRRICRWRRWRRTPGDRESGRQPVAVEAGPVRPGLTRRAVRWWRWWWRIRRRICRWRWRRWRRRIPGDRESGRQPVAVEAGPVRPGLDRRAVRWWRWWRRDPPADLSVAVAAVAAADPRGSGIRAAASCR